MEIRNPKSRNLKEIRRPKAESRRQKAEIGGQLALIPALSRNDSVGEKLALIRRREDAMAGQAPALSPGERENLRQSPSIFAVSVNSRALPQERPC